MSCTSLRGATVSLLAVLVLSACGTTGRSADYALAHTPALSDLTEGSWTADGIEDANRDIVPGSTITLTFDNHAVAANAGCNILRGPAAINDDKLVVGKLASTMKACEESLQAQDEWLSSFLTSQPTITRQSNDLWLTRDDTLIHFTATDDS
jgi:heat shock protein HslJ